MILHTVLPVCNEWKIFESISYEPMLVRVVQFSAILEFMELMERSV